MSLTIVLINPITAKSAIQPGSRLSGTVTFTTSVDTAISKVIVSLSGRCKVKIREHLHYTTRSFRSRGYYFYLTQTVFDGGGYTHKAGNYEWPFEFTVPENAERQGDLNVPEPKGVKGRRYLDHNGIMKVAEESEENGRRYDNFPSQSPWTGTRDSRLHPLPDSFNCVQTVRSVDWEGRVEYALIAKLERPSQSAGSKIFSSVSRGQPLETVVGLTLINATNKSQNDLLDERRTQTFERWAIGERIRPTSGFGRLLSRTTTTHNTKRRSSPDDPTRMLITVTTPKAIQVRSLLEFAVTAAIDNNGSDYISFRPSIRALTVSLIRKISVRDDSRAATPHTAIKHETTILFRHTRDRPASNRSCGDFQMLPTYDLWPGPVGHGPNAEFYIAEFDDPDHAIRTPAATMTPNFATYNIAVEYFFRFDMTIVNDYDEEFVFISNEAPGQRVEVLPAPPSVVEGSLDGNMAALNLLEEGKRLERTRLDVKVGANEGETEAASEKEAEATREEQERPHGAPHEDRRRQDHDADDLPPDAP